MTPTEFYSVILAVSLALVAIVLSTWQWLERRQRPAALSPEDSSHFASQKLRRNVVAGAMILLAIGIFFGSRIDPRHNGRPNVWFIECWLAIVALVIVLLGLALVDWVATRRYARRHRRAMLREGLRILSDEARLRDSRASNGRLRENADGVPPA